MIRNIRPFSVINLLIVVIYFENGDPREFKFESEAITADIVKDPLGRIRLNL